LTNTDIDPNDPESNNPPPDAEAQELEGRARRMGWRPQEEFRGDPVRWTDAKTFIERGENELPVLRERYRTLDDRYGKLQTEQEATRKEVSEVRKSAKEMQETLLEFRERSKRAEEMAYSRARTDLESRMAVAVEQADANGYNRAKMELDRLNDAERQSMRVPEPPRREDPPQNRTDTAQNRAETPPGSQTVDPAVEQWVSENQWFTVNRGMAGYATAEFQTLREQRPGVPVRELLDEVRERVKTTWPAAFDNPRRKDPATVNQPSGQTAPRRKGPPPFAQWPADAKAGYEKAKRWMPDYKQEEYASMYFAGDE